MAIRYSRKYFFEDRHRGSAYFYNKLTALYLFLGIWQPFIIPLRDVDKPITNVTGICCYYCKG